jgi:hypothetical protein
MAGVSSAEALQKAMTNERVNAELSKVGLPNARILETVKTVEGNTGGEETPRGVIGAVIGALVVCFILAAYFLREKRRSAIRNKIHDSCGMIGIDFGWKKILEDALKRTPLATSLIEAIRSMSDLVDVGVLEDIVKEKRKEWEEQDFKGDCNLPASYELDFAIAIHVYTLGEPAVHAAVNEAMFDKGRRQAGAISGISVSLRACLPYIKYLDTALEKLPDCYSFQGEVRRGVKTVFPSVDNHDPKSHFPEGKKLMWYQFMSSSGAKSETDIQKVMQRKHFCGVDPGPRTIFTVKVTRAYDIHKFSFFQGAEGEHEVLFRPFSTFKVVHAQKNILDPKEVWVENAIGVNREAAYKASLDKSASPDSVVLQQVCDDEEGNMVDPASCDEEGATATTTGWWNVSMPLTALGWHPLCCAESQKREKEEKAAAELSKEKQTKDEESPAVVLAEEAREKTDARKKKAKDEARTKKAEVEEEARFLLKAAAKKEEDVLAKKKVEEVITVRKKEEEARAANDVKKRQEFLAAKEAKEKREEVQHQAEQELRSKLEAARKKEEDDFRETVKYVRALFAYDAAAEVELDLKEGDVIKVLKEDDGDWWQGEVEGRVGW